MSLEFDDELATATEQGRICALAAGGQRDLQQCAATYPQLFPGKPFDGALFSNIALAMAFSAPWCETDQLRIANRAVLWGFAADWLVDYQATSREEVDDLAARCLAVADGARPAADDHLGVFLAEIRDELATRPPFAAHHGAWREELRRMLAGMAVEWTWKAARPARPAGAAATSGPQRAAASPTFDEYLDNADNLGSSWVNVSHWLFQGSPDSLAHLPGLIVVNRAAQRVLRLVNDLASHQRDLDWGDLNALVLGTGRAEVTRQIGKLVDRCRDLARPLQEHCPLEVRYLARQLGFSTGFYRSTDFWGGL